MKRLISYLLVALFFAMPLMTNAQEATDSSGSTKDPYGREADETGDEGDSVTSSATSADELNYASTVLAGEGDQLEAAFGSIDDEGNFTPGSLKGLKLRPGDKKRLTKIANGSLTKKQQKDITYDQRALELLNQLTAPKELGGAGIDHIRIDDFLRFKSGQRSKETEQTDNISAHYSGRAFDVTEIGTTFCVEKSSGLFGVGGSEKKLPPFPVKVIWQGGAPYNPTTSEMTSYDTAARNKAFNQLISVLPANSFNGDIASLTDVLQRLQRRAIAQELGLPRESLDTVVNNDLLETLGRAALNNELELPVGSLQGNSKDERLRSLGRASFENALQLPSGSFAGDSVNDSLERLGRYIVASHNDIAVGDILGGKIGDLKNYNYYQKAEAAFDLPSGVISGVKSNDKNAFRAIGAQYLGRKLKYSPEELTSLVNQAKQGQANQLLLARFGDITTLPTESVLPIVAPGKDSSKAAGERYIGEKILASTQLKSPDTLDQNLLAQLTRRFPGLTSAQSKSTISETLLNNNQGSEMYRLLGATQIEKAFDLPTGTFVKLLTDNKTPTLEQYGLIVGPSLLEEELASTLTDQEVKALPENQRAGAQNHDLRYYFNRQQMGDIIDSHLNLKPGTTAQYYQKKLSQKQYQDIVGKAFTETTFVDNFQTMYPVPSVGVAKVSAQAIFSLLLGKIDNTSTVAGAAWAEEDLGMIPDSFTTVVSTNGSSNQRMVSAGVAVLGGHLYEAYDIDGSKVSSLNDLINVIGQARVETTLGLRPGTFSGSLNDVKKLNVGFDDRFASPTAVDNLLGLSGGSTQKFLAGSLSISSMVNQVGKKDLEAIDVNTLHTKFGWPDAYKLVTEQQSSSSGQPKPQPLSQFDGSKLTDLLEKIGSYNLDYSFGYEPGTISDWSSSGNDSLFLEQGGRLFDESIGIEDPTKTSLFSVYKGGGNEQAVLGAITQATSIPDSRDVQSFTQGNMYQALTARDTAARIKNTDANLGGNSYQLLRSAILGWSYDSNLFNSISQKNIDNYSEILSEQYEPLKSTNPDIAKQFLDFRFRSITQGVLNKDGTLNMLASPYNDTINNQIKSGYFGSQGMRNEVLYSSIDASIGKKFSGVPDGFSEALLGGSAKKRSDMLFQFLNAKKGDGILDSLPSDLRSSVESWLGSRSSSTGSTLAGNDAFNSWAADILSKNSDTPFSSGTVQTAVKLLSGGNTGGIISENPGLFSPTGGGLGANGMTGLINNQLGLESGQFSGFYSNYSRYNGLVADYKAGNLDQAQLVFAADSMFLGGKLTEFTNSIDSTLGLPPGTTQLVVSYYLTGNPVYLAQLAGNLLGGSSQVVCPDLQQEAQKNIKKLITEVINQGQDSARLIPSQIITYNPEYLDDLNDKILENYSVCLNNTNSRCGVFARQEYAKQVHIGF